MQTKEIIRTSMLSVLGSVLFLNGLFMMPSVTFAGTPPNGFGDDSQVREDAFNIPRASEGKQGEEVLNVVKGIVNWVLGILAFIALILLLYGGFMMVTAAGDSGQYEKGGKYLKSAIIGLAIIGLARFIASLIFWLINLTTSQAGTSAGTDS